jgi:formylglycine-generating enzyme required for sulfatase activity
MPTQEKPAPKYYPVPGFEDCVHAEVVEACEVGWCELPPTCFVMGSPEGEWRYKEYYERQAAVTLTNRLEAQQMELTRAEWKAITGLDSIGPETCADASCPVAMVSWWDAVSAADLLSESRGLKPCYEPVDCTGALGVDLECAGVAEPESSVYECEGYRLPTRAEVEYAARAGTWSTWYSGDITAYDDLDCHLDVALEKIAWYCFNFDGKVHIPGSLDKNSFGLYDLIGNIQEWIGESKEKSSLGGFDPAGEIGSSDRRLIFSGRADLASYLARSANLMDAKSQSRGQMNGFRLYRTLFEDSERSKAIVER